MKTVSLLQIIFALVHFVPSIWAQSYRLEPLSSFGFHGDGSVRPGDYSFLTADGQRYQRGMAYNPVTGHVLVVNRDPAGLGIYIFDGMIGDWIGNLDFSSFLPGGNENFVINLIAVADDGAIYVGNLTSATSPPQYRLYRWENEAAPQTLVYPNPSTNPGDPSNGNTDTINRRWGDTMAIRGSGTNTEVLLASRGTLISILTPINGDLNTFTSTVVQTSVSAGALGYGLTFGPGDTIYGTAGAQSGGPLYVLQRPPGAANATTLASFGAALMPNALTPISIGRVFGRDFLAGITMVPGPDIVRLYEITNVASAPVFMDRESFITETNNPVFGGAVAFGDNRLYALDSDNGLMAFSIVEDNSPVAPAIFLQPASRNVLIGSNVTFTVAADGTAPLAYQWFSNGSNALANATNISLVVSNAQSSDSGNYSVVVSNAAGATQSSNASLFVAAQPTATRLVYEPFDYPPDTALAGQGGWLLNSGASGITEAGNLSVTGLVASSGNRLFWRQASMSLRLPLNTNITSGSLYYSFAMSVESIGGGFTSAGVLAGFTTGTGTSFGTKVDITNNANGTFTLGTSKPGAVTLRFDTNQFLPGATVFLVGRYTFNPSTGDDISELWINPDSTTFGADSAPPPNLVTTGGNDLAQIDRFFFRAGSAASTPEKLIVDELRVGGTWADVTPSSIAAQPRLLIARSGQSVVIRWVAAQEAYTLETADNLPASWQMMTEAAMHDNGTNTVIVAIDDVQGFFRLRNGQ